MAETFEKEERYLVLKIKSMEEVVVAELKQKYASFMVECVVVESDWEPEHSQVWSMIRKRQEGNNG